MDVRHASLPSRERMARDMSLRLVKDYSRAYIRAIPDEFMDGTMTLRDGTTKYDITTDELRRMASHLILKDFMGGYFKPTAPVDIADVYDFLRTTGRLDEIKRMIKDRNLPNVSGV